MSVTSASLNGRLTVFGRGRWLKAMPLEGFGERIVRVGARWVFGGRERALTGGTGAVVVIA